MSEYPRHMSEPVVTQYHGLEIAVRTSAEPRDHALSEVTASYEITQNGEARWRHSVAGGHRTAADAAKNALRVAKQLIFENGEGPEPD